MERGEGERAFGDVDCPESERVEVGEQPSRGTMLRWWESEWRFASSQRQAEEDRIQFVKEEARARAGGEPRFGVWRSRLDGIMGVIPAWGKWPRGTCESKKSTAPIVQKRSIAELAISNCCTGRDARDLHRGPMIATSTSLADSKSSTAIGDTCTFNTSLSGAGLAVQVLEA